MSRPRLPVAPALAALAVVVACTASGLVTRAGAAATTTPFKPQTALTFEGMGSGEIYTFNVDRRVTRGTALRAGFGWWSGEGGIYVLPLTASALIGETNLCIELGGGPLFLLGGDTSDFGSNVIVTTFAGIRYEPRSGGLFLRGGIGPLYGGGNWDFWPTVSVGYVF